MRFTFTNKSNRIKMKDVLNEVWLQTFRCHVQATFSLMLLNPD